MGIDRTTPDLERPMFDLSVAHFTRVHRGIRVQGVWLRDDEDIAGWEPALALTNASTWRLNSDNPDSNVCLVTMRQAWAWSEPRQGDDPLIVREMARIAARSCRLFARNLGLTENNQATLMSVLMVVRDHLGDLLAMPPKPPTDETVVADVTWSDPRTGAVKHGEVTDHDA